MAMDSNSNQIVTDFPPVLRIYEDGRVERLFGSAYVTASPDQDSTIGVSSKDTKISSDISARLFLPQITDSSQKLPILVYFHGGGFCGESAFSSLNHNYMTLLVSEAKALAVSVEYRLAPERFLPAAYEDSWAALQWVASHVVHNSNSEKEPWLVKYGDFNKIYLGGESAGANIVHNLAMKASVERLQGGVKIFGAFLSHPYFWGSKFESQFIAETNEHSLSYKLWVFAYPSAAGGIDHPMINPFADDAPSLSGIGCLRLFVSVAGIDRLRKTGVLYVEALRRSSWKGEVEFVESEGEDHVFHVLNPHSEKAKSLIKQLASFIK